MIKRVQRLLKPSGLMTLGETAIDLPPSLAEALRLVFSFDVGGCAELEHDAFYKSFCRFNTLMQADNICRIRFDAEELDDARPPVLHALAPITQAEGVISFIEDQLGPETIRTVRATGLKRTLQDPETDIGGWFDLDTPAFLFTDTRPAVLLSLLLNRTWNDIPQIDRLLEYCPRSGEPKPIFERNLARLAQAWGYPVAHDFNGITITATRAP